MENNFGNREWFLIIRSSNEKLQEYRIKPIGNTLGRGRENDIVLNDNAASKQHAVIHYDQINDVLRVQDLGSTNGTFVNGKRISASQILNHEDHLRIGFCLITIIHTEPRSNLGDNAHQAKKKVTSELILESIDHYGVLLHDIERRLVNVPDLSKVLIEITELIKRMIGADECQIVLADQFDGFEKRGIPGPIARKIIEKNSAVTFSYPEGNASDQNMGNLTRPAQAMLLVPVIIDGDVVALIFARKSTKSSNLFYNSDLQLVLAVSNQVAVSIQRNRVEGILVHNSTHDSLTDLPNRNLFLERLSALIEGAKENQDIKFAVLFFDIDDFKIVNDSLGHATGDKLLVAMAERLKFNAKNNESLSRISVMARFGGDEFAVLLENIKETSPAIMIANNLKEILSKPFNINGKEIYTTVSIGVAINTNSYEHSEDILRDADMAMYQAKELGKNHVEIYDKAMHDRAVLRMQLGTALRQGALHKEFRLHYQPIMSLQTGSLVGFEALLRWYTPKQGILTPDDFMNAIELAGLIFPTDQWVIYNACRQAAIWQDKYPESEFPFISVNLSAKNIKHPNLVNSVGRVLHETKLDPKRLWLEITEQASVSNDESVISILNHLRSLGVRISLDDFGTGYSALSYLARFPIDALKIDRSFIKMIGVNQENLKIIEILKALANNLGLVLIAEGVETGKQIPFLKSIKCEYVQGFYYSHPLDSESATKFLEEYLRKEPFFTQGAFRSVFENS